MKAEKIGETDVGAAKMEEARLRRVVRDAQEEILREGRRESLLLKHSERAARLHREATGEEWEPSSASRDAKKAHDEAHR